MATPAPKKGIKIKVGDRVSVTGLVGTIRFIGLTKFAPEKWVGVELDKPEGKNDGSVKGVKYFTCQPKYGLFAKPNMVRLHVPGKENQEGEEGEVEDDDVPPSPIPATAAAPVKPIASVAPAIAKPKPAPAVVASAVAGPAGGGGSSSGDKTTSQLVEEKREALKKIKEKQDALAQPSDGTEKKPTVSVPAVSPSKPAAVAPASKPTSSGLSEGQEKKLLDEIATANREIDKLKKQVVAAEEAAKLAKDVPALKKQVGDLQASLDKSKKDKETAEDKLLEMGQDLELATEELALVKLDLEELRSEKDGNREQLLSSLPADQAGLARLTEQNGQLTAALRKLRDKYAEEKQAADEYRSETEATLASLKAKAEKSSALEEQVSDLKSANEDLKQALEEAGGYEQMVEDLTEKNLTLGEKNKKLKDEVDYLNSLKSAAEEVEEGHVDLENQLQSELESKDAEIQECHRQLKVKQTLIEDLNATQRQFRDLVKTLENEARELRVQQENAQGMSRDESERARKARIANLTLQSKVSEVRTKSVEHMAAKLEAAEAQTRLAFYERHIPDNVNVDNGALEFLLSLDRLNLKASFLAKLLAESYGLNTHNEGQAHFTYDLCSRLTDLAKAVETLRHCVGRTQDEELFLKLVGERGGLQSPEAILDDFVQMLMKDTFNEAISLQTLTSAEENITGFLAGYFMGEEDERGNRKLKFPPPLTIASDVTKIYYTQSVVAVYFQGISDTLTILPKNKDGAPDQALANALEQLTLASNGNTDVCSSMLNQAKSYQVFAQGRGVAPAAFDADIKTCSAAVFACLVRAKSLFEWISELVKRGVDEGNRALVVEQIETRLATETTERRLLSELTSAQMVLRDLRTRLEAVPDAKEESRQTTMWEKRAGIVRQELLQAASLQSALEEATKKSEEKARELFLGQKKTRELQSKVEVLEQQLVLVRGKADDTSELRGETEKLKRRLAEAEAASEAMGKDLEASSEAAKTLRKKVLKLKFDLKQAKESGGGRPQGGASEGVALLSGKQVTSLTVAAGEINLLLRTIAALRQQLAQQRASSFRAELTSALPPLPVVQGHVVQAGPTAAQAQAQQERLQLFAPASKAELTSLQGMGEELGLLSAKTASLRASATLLDVSSAASVKQANQLWLANQAEVFRIKHDTAQLRDKVSGFLAGKQAASFRCLFASTPASGAAVPGAPSSQLIGRVVVPSSVTGTMKAVVDRRGFDQLHSVFLR